MSTSQSLKSLAVRITQDLATGTSVSVPHSVACAEWTRDKKIMKPALFISLRVLIQ